MPPSVAGWKARPPLKRHQLNSSHKFLFPKPSLPFAPYSLTFSNKTDNRTPNGFAIRIVLKKEKELIKTKEKLVFTQEELFNFFTKNSKEE